MSGWNNRGAGGDAGFRGEARGWEWGGGAHIEADGVLRVHHELALGCAAAAFEGDDGGIHLPPVAGAVHLVGLAKAAVAAVLLHQPHLEGHMRAVQSEPDDGSGQKPGRPRLKKRKRGSSNGYAAMAGLAIGLAERSSAPIWQLPLLSSKCA